MKYFIVLIAISINYGKFSFLSQPTTTTLFLNHIVVHMYLNIIFRACVWPELATNKLWPAKLCSRPGKQLPNGCPIISLFMCLFFVSCCPKFVPFKFCFKNLDWDSDLSS